MDYEINNSVDFDESESIWKFDGPIGRKDYIWLQLGIFFVVGLIYWLKTFAILLFPLLIILILILFYLSFASTSKRYYDITGSLKSGIIIAIVIFLINFVIPLVGLIGVGCGVIIPGKLIKPKS